MKRSVRLDFLLALGIATLVSLGLFTYGALRNHSFEYNYLIWNLFLAWLPLVFALRLVHILRYKLLSSWEALGFGTLWLLFLPNSFYLITDLIHLREVRRVDILYDAVMFTSFIYLGVVLGFASLYLVHMQLKERLSRFEVRAVLAATFVLSSFAIYIGRDLRWNSWDLLTNPGGLLFDISERLQHPSAYPTMLMTMATFSILLASMYWLLLCGIRLVRGSRD